MIQRTLALIKPDAVKSNYIGSIINIAEKSGLKVVALQMFHFTQKQARGFYAVHEGKHFFDGLLQYITESPLVAIVFEGEDAVTSWRNLMGATDPQKAAEGTIRKLYAESMTRNSVHGSDSVENAEIEINYVFGGRYINGLA
ncbi:MAG: nucleoside-diphosphate kinase [Deltaproteobacteria bacterium]|nr:nucleoside-diphosphate kinase [Deltaproteobacteria bacterium]